MGVDDDASAGQTELELSCSTISEEEDLELSVLELSIAVDWLGPADNAEEDVIVI